MGICVHACVAHISVTFVLSSSSGFLLTLKFKAFWTKSAWKQGKWKALAYADNGNVNTMRYKRLTTAETDRKTAEDKSYPNMLSATALLIVGIADHYQHSRKSAAFPPRDKTDKYWFT